ncbi:MAG: PD-(D/E)XK nuclease family protein [Lentisphaerae bacterium]|nr:PD-(D/E)XK nuclease family protein [Lentisphaerota bacterium]
MNITFGMFLDGTQWSEKSASLGEIICGPGAFLALLEQRTGLSGVEVSLPERINEYRAKIEAVNPLWCRASFQLDSWSTAKQMLASRDELYLNGWNGADGNSNRLKALARIEKSAPPLSSGIPDRMKRLLAELEKFTFSDTLCIRDNFELLPFYWQKIINQLGKCGMKIIVLPPEENSSPEIIKVSGNNEYVLATELCRYLSAGDNQRVALICEGKSEVLDGILRRFGKGMIGNTQSSRWRESLQLLPLWLETLWKPFNPLRFLELLTLPHSIISANVARALIKALQKAPGINGIEWSQALENIKNDIQKNTNGFYKNTKAEIEKIAALQKFIEQECFTIDPNTGALEKTLIERCEYLEKHLAPQIEKFPELAIPVTHAGILKKIAANKGIINKVALARMLDSIVSTGTAPGTDKRQVTDFAVFSHPGMISGKFDTVLWWNCIDRGHSKGTAWSADEIDVMPGFNRSKERKLENNAWQMAKNAAQKEFIAFIPQQIEGETVFHHALLDDPAIVSIEPVPSEKLVTSKGIWQLGSRKKKLTPGKQTSNSTVPLDCGAEIKVARRLSYSQLNTFLSCPRQWLFQDYLALQKPAAMTLPTGAPMLGTLAHKVVETLYCGTEKISADEAKRDAGRIFDKLIPAMAAELLLGGRNIERDRFRKTLVDSIYSLVSEINRRNLRVKGCETKLSGNFEGIDFIGFSDILLEDKNGKAFVIDMKWSTSGSYEKNLKENKALQLATYSWLLSPENMDVECAYYLFPKQKFIHQPDADWQTLWQNARQCWAERMAALRSNKLEKGISDEKKLQDSPLPLKLTAGCDYCDFAALCDIIGE